MSTKVKIAVVGSSVSNYVDDTHKPEYIYIPLEDKNKNIYISIVKEKEYIYKGQLVGINKKNNLKVYSSVSGYVIRTEKHLLDNGKRVNTIIIENDYKEKTRKNYIDFFNKQNFINSLKENNIINLKNYNNIKYLIINAVEEESMLTNTTAFYYYNIENILEKIDNILEILNIKKGIIVIDKTNKELINNIKKYIGTYPKIEIKIIDNYYTSTYSKNIIKNLYGITYEKSSLEKGILLFNINILLLLVDMLNQKRIFTEKVITIGDITNKKYTKIKVKIGSLASDVIKQLNYQNCKNNVILIVGNLLEGKSLSNDDLIITKDVNSILIANNTKERRKECIKCGKCINICPEKLLPAFIINNEKNINKLKKLNLEKCSECGLCSYICPSKIPIKEIIIDTKERINSYEEI